MFVAASDITFGLEVETKIPDNYRRVIPVGSYSSGSPIADFPGWRGKSDASVSETYHKGTSHYGVEVVSPILSGEDGLIQVVAMLDMLTDMGAYFDSETGVHVHVGTGYLPKQELYSVRDSYVHYEKVWYGLNGVHAGSRWVNHYCKPSHRATYESDRYQGVNVTTQLSSSDSVHRRPTIECRAFHGNCDPYVIVSAICGLVALYSGYTDGIRPLENKRIADTNDAARQFVRKYLYRRKYRIVPEGDMFDLSKTIYHQCALAAPLLGEGN